MGEQRLLEGSPSLLKVIDLLILHEVDDYEYTCVVDNLCNVGFGNARGTSPGRPTSEERGGGRTR